MDRRRPKRKRVQLAAGAESRKKRAHSTSESAALQVEPLEISTTSHSGTARDYGDLPLLMRASEVADALGISRALAYRWMAGGVLPTIRRGRSIRVPREALLTWIEHNTQQAGN